MKNLMEGWRGYLKESAGEQEHDREDLMQMIRDYSKELTGRRDNYGDLETLSRMSLEQLQEYYQGMFDSPEAQYMADKIKDEEDAALGQDDEYDMMPTQSGMGRGLREGDYNQQWKLFLEDCWDGYERVPGTKEGEKGSCRKKTDEAKKDKDPCWDGYEQVGMKEKDGKEVPNCVPKQNEAVGGPESLQGKDVRILSGGLAGAEGEVIELTTTGGIGVESGLPAVVVRLTKAADKRIYGGPGDEVIARVSDVEVDKGIQGDDSVDPEDDYNWVGHRAHYQENKINEARMSEYGKMDAEQGLPPTKIGRGNPEYMEAYNAVLIARGEEPLDVQQPDQAYLDALHSGRLEEALYKILSEGEMMSGEGTYSWSETPDGALELKDARGEVWGSIEKGVGSRWNVYDDEGEEPLAVAYDLESAKVELLDMLDIADDAMNEGGKCTKATEKTTSTAKGKKYMKCIKNPDGEGYIRKHWGQKGARAAPKGSKRNKSFRARHGCSDAKAGTAKKLACDDW